jgi:SAM-dependent methyltransferase
MPTAIQQMVATFASGLAEGSVVLDVGCGMRPYEALFAHCQYVGIDVEASGRKADYKKPDRYFDGLNIPYDSDSFQAVLCTEVLEHCVDPQALALEMHRVLTPGGRLLVTVPFMWGEHEMPYDFRRYSRNGIARQLETVGFASVAVERLTRGVDAIEMLVHSEIVNYEQNVAPPAGTTVRARRRFSDRLWALQLRLWRRLYDFERIYVDNAVIAVKDERR